jgi:hypothetical protein
VTPLQIRVVRHPARREWTTWITMSTPLNRLIEEECGEVNMHIVYIVLLDIFDGT